MLLFYYVFASSYKVVKLFLVLVEQALRSAPMHGDDMAMDPVATLYVNRASAFYVSTNSIM